MLSIIRALRLLLPKAGAWLRGGGFTPELSSLAGRAEEGNVLGTCGQAGRQTTQLCNQVPLISYFQVKYDNGDVTLPMPLGNMFDQPHVRMRSVVT